MLVLCETCKSHHREIKSIHNCEYCGKEICDNCGNLIDDMFWECDNCNKLPQYKFPERFYHFGESKSAAEVNNDEIIEMLSNVKKKLTNQDIGGYTLESTGDTIVIGLKMLDEYTFMVCKGRYEISVDPKHINFLEF